MRSKEEANDYRYFTDPDLLPLDITNEQIEAVRSALPELPQDKLKRFIDQYALSYYDAVNLVSSRALASYFETVYHLSRATPKLVANWIMGDLMAALNKENLDIAECPIDTEAFAKLIERISDNTISGKIAKTVFEALWKKEGTVDDIIQQRGLKQVSDDGAIEKLVDTIIAENPDHVAEYRSGKEKLFGFFVGQAMKASGGKMNPQLLNALLKKKLAS